MSPMNKMYPDDTYSTFAQLQENKMRRFMINWQFFFSFLQIKQIKQMFKNNICTSEKRPF